MKFIARSASINDLKLSKRSHNGLKRANIGTVGELADFPRDELMSLKNLGAKSVTEILEVLNEIEIIETDPTVDITSLHDNKTDRKQVIGADGKMYYDIKIEDIGLSKRSYNCMRFAGINYYSQMLSMEEADLFALPKMGRKSVSEIIEKRNKINLQPVVEKESTATEDSKLVSDCAQLIVQDFIGKMPINAGQLYDAIFSILTNKDTLDCASPLRFGPALQRELFSSPVVFRTLEEGILYHLEQSPYGLDRAELQEIFPKCLSNQDLLNELIEDLVNEGSMFFRRDELYERNYISAWDYATSLSKEQDRKVLQGRLEGKTLEEIGNGCNITRERVRQIVAKCLRKAPRFFEDRYAEVYQKYDLPESDFLLGFKAPNTTYYYLANMYKGGNRPISELVLDVAFPDEFRKAAERIVYKNYVVLNGERVLCQRSELSEYILRMAGVEGVTFEEFKQLYQILLEDIGKEDDPKLSVTGRGYENQLSGSHHVLWKYGRKLRYYNIDAYDFGEFFETLDLNQYQNVEYSTLKFFREYPDLMKDYGIEDEYELHNLLKKICRPEAFPDIQFNRMPNIEFGTADRDGQVRELMLALAPVTRADLAQAYEDEYGVGALTVSANYFKGFDLYYHAGMYKIDTPALPEIMVSKLRQRLTDDFYLLSRIREIYADEFPNSTPDLLNPFTIKSLGFRVYANYAISNRYSTATEYFRDLLTTEDLVDAQSFSHGILSIISYTSELYKSKASYDIVEYAPFKYVNIRRLNQAGIDKTVLKDYCDKVFEGVGTKYFTIHSLQQTGFSHVLDKLGFDAYFYMSLLVEDKTQFSYHRIGKNKLFLRGKDSVHLTDFLEWLLYMQESLSIYIDELVELLKEGYDISIDQYKILETINGSSMYYDVITEKVYADYDVYFEEI